MNTPILERLDSGSIARLKNSAKKAQALENYWDYRIRSYLEQSADAMIEQLLKNDLPLSLEGLDLLFVEHSFDVAGQAMRIASAEEEKFDQHRLTLPKARIPKSLRDLMALYDQWLSGKYRPKRPLKESMSVKKLYLDKVQDVWRKYSEGFRKGDVYSQEQVRKQIKEAAQTTQSRAATIVRTETTNYYNTARKQVYDESQDVTHYLFMAVRDTATTKWCTAKTVNGKRGRHGLVYEKGDPLLAAECPACHWNCRSELLPLTPLNPAHARLINDKSIQRRNVICHPLPRGWRAA